MSDLRPQLGLLDATMINVGTMVASAIFLVPSIIAAEFSASGPTVLVWVVGGLVSLFGALCVAELGAALPKAGGLYAYLERGYGPVWGFLYGWGASVIINPGSIAAIAVGFASYLGHFVPLGPWGVKLAAAGSILALTGLNCLGLRVGAVTQNILTLLKIAAVVGLVAACVLLPGGSVENFRPVWPAESAAVLAAPFGAALISALWAYDGWIEITYVGSELRRPGRDMPLSIIVSTVLVMVLYVAVSLAVLYVLGRPAMAASTLVARDSLQVVLGVAGGALVTSAILISTLGANNGIVFTAARIPYAMARDGLFFRWAGRLDRRTDTPVTALVVQGLWSAALVFSGTYQQLATYVVFVSFLFYAMGCGAVLLLRAREPALPRPYRTWGYPVTPVVFILFSIWLVANTILEAPRDAAVGAGLLLAGLSVFWYLRRRVPAPT